MSTLLRLLTSPLALSLAVLLLFSYTCLHAITNRRLLRNFRGPLLAKTSRSWLFWQSLRARVNLAQFEALQQHGKSPETSTPNYRVLSSNTDTTMLTHARQDRHVALAPTYWSPTTRTWYAT
jgi:hypothetical protein